MNGRRLGIWILVLVGSATAGASGQTGATRRTSPLPPEAPIYRGGSVFRPSPRVPVRNAQGQPHLATRPHADASPPGNATRAPEIQPTSAEIMAEPPLVETFVGDAFPIEEYPDAWGSACCEFGSCEPAVLFAGRGPTPWSAGVEFTLLKPQFGSNPALTALDSDGATFENFTTTSFDYDRQLSSPSLDRSATVQSTGHSRGVLAV